MDVRVDEITGVRFGRGPYPFPSFPGREILTVEFLGPDGESSLSCFVHDLYDGQRMRPEKLQASQALRERYGSRDESRVDRGRLLPSAALNHPDHRSAGGRVSRSMMRQQRRTRPAVAPPRDPEHMRNDL